MLLFGVLHAKFTKTRDTEKRCARAHKQMYRVHDLPKHSISTHTIHNQPACYRVAASELFVTPVTWQVPRAAVTARMN